MSGLVLPTGAPQQTRSCVVRSLMAVPRLTRLLDTPGLLVAVCFDAATSIGGFDQDRLQAAANTPHRQLAAQLGLPSLGILRRLAGSALSEVRLQRLRSLFGDRRALQLLRHARFIHAAIIDSLAIPEVNPHIANRFVIEIGESAPSERPRACEVVALGKFLHAFLPETEMQSLRHFERLWEDCFEEMRGYHSAVRRPDAFPPPPWSDEPGYAVAIQTPWDLVAESVKMRNCAGLLPAFRKEIRRGQSYFFHVEGYWGLPESTMLCVKDGDHWRIDDVRARCNGTLDRHYVQSLALWVAEKQGVVDADDCLPTDKKHFHPFGVRRGQRIH